MTRPFALRCGPLPPLTDAPLLFDLPTMWASKKIGPGDRVYVFSAEHLGGVGLVLRGRVLASEPGGGIRWRITVAPELQATRPLGRADLRPHADLAAATPQAELGHRLFRQATPKIIAISAAAAALLDSHFG